MKQFIKSREGKNICVIIEKSENQKWLVFLMHWFWGSKDEKLIRKCSEIFRNNDFTVISFDTRNTFWESDWNYEEWTITNYYTDLEDVIFWASKEDFYEEKFYLSGHSLWWICTTLFTQKFPEKVKALIPISPVVSWKLSLEIMDKNYLLELKKVWYILKKSNSVPWRIKKVNYSHYEDRLKYNLLEKADKMNLPILIIVWQKDETTPVIHQKLLFEKLTCKKELKIIKNSKHSFKDFWELEEVWEILNNFIKNNI